ncbi:hypothetical protein BT93_L4127 [Corymbia citriodora subsp. variegata]|uniref:Uncharacterized protein n=1 Tax=Corymbia citriodora subsp. variegata TaxID=360336 RepID=A0A8T0CG77_CORYI|nr:hypothetical protein BT93_L4127 [Corymbia citriodora subsp. variegata]
MGVGADHDSEWVRSIMLEVDGAEDGSWSLLPHSFASFMTFSICLQHRDRRLQQQRSLLDKVAFSIYKTNLPP